MLEAALSSWWFTQKGTTAGREAQRSAARLELLPSLSSALNSSTLGPGLLPSKSLSTEGAPPPLLVFFMFTQNLLGRRKKKPPPEKQTLLSAFSLKQSFIHLLAGSPEWNLPLTCSKVTLQHPVLNNQILLNVTLQQKRALSLGMPRWH